MKNNKQELITIGKGTYGEVYRIGQSNRTIKRTYIDPKKGIHFTTYRETRVLKALHHPNIIKLLDIIVNDHDVNLILEYMPFDLSGLIRSDYPFTPLHISSITWQLLSAISYIHASGFIYRDLKPGNILLNREGELKLTDFGMTKECQDEMTNRVCSLWYRAPELLLGSDSYSQKIDCWSVGCVLIEIGIKKPVFKGLNEVDQVRVISKEMGLPTKKYPWSDLFDLQKNKEDEFWAKYGKFVPDKLLNICKGLMRLDEELRLEVDKALEMFIRQPVLQKIDFSDVHDLAVEDQYNIFE